MTTTNFPEQIWLFNICLSIIAGQTQVAKGVCGPYPTVGRPPSLPKTAPKTATGSKGKLRAQISTPVVHRSRGFFSVCLGIIFFNFQCWYSMQKWGSLSSLRCFFLRHLWGCFWSRHFGTCHDDPHQLKQRMLWLGGFRIYVADTPIMQLTLTLGSWLAPWCRCFLEQRFGWKDSLRSSIMMDLQLYAVK